MLLEDLIYDGCFATISKYGTVIPQTFDFQTAYLENKFHITLQPYGGYKNEAGYILKHERFTYCKSSRLKGCY